MKMMNIKTIRTEEVQQVLDMYNETRQYDKKLCSVDTFCRQYLSRCECCGKLFYWEDLRLVNENMNCCEECYEVIKDDEKVVCNKDEYDEMIDMKLERGLI